MKSPLKWLKERSAKSRFNLFSKQHDDAAARHFEATRQQPAEEERAAVPVFGPPQFRQPMPEQEVVPPPPTELIGLPAPVGAGIRTVTSRGERPSFIDAGYQNTTSDPNNLKKVTTILPYADYQPLDLPDTQIADNLKEPDEIELSTEEAPIRTMESTVFQWQPSNLWHYPLYFEDPGLERSGHTFEPWLQPFASVGRFGLQAVGMPYQLTLDPVCKKRYSLGWYRPGECAPKQVGQIPWNTKAVFNQAAVVTGAFFALP